ncbi:N-acyl homoserine lactonase family protein [Paracoccus sp. pheM1]|uniref:N-acyl homoserine lactonase family protein n=1 Tax=Paracoccus sp. pheM1 TaxID=2831675 RepID=UPI001BDB6E89|nr:N-acyl homoserine lactonase family protein [Paracoccus sp. pheM1]MBT0781888.1 N-acyl homoserine lactonase family protein [Paracoccus sp. pheM1]
MARIRMTALDVAPLSLEKAKIATFQPGHVDLVTTVAVIEHERHGILLWDTGINGAVLDPEAGYWAPGLAEAFGTQGISRDHIVDRQLERLGIGRGDVRHVVYSHLHLDHSGGAEYFPDAVHVAQRAELNYAFCPDPWTRPVYCDKDIDRLRRVELLPLKGDADLFGDGSVRLLRTPGHAPGHQSLLLDLPHRGRILLGGDVAHQRDQYRNHIPMPWDHCLSDTTASRRRVAAIERGGVPLFLCHEQADFAQLPTQGTFWD